VSFKVEQGVSSFLTAYQHIQDNLNIFIHQENPVATKKKQT